MEKRLRKSSWPIFVIGGALLVLGKQSQSANLESYESSARLRSQLDAGNLKVDAGTAYLIKKHSDESLREDGVVIESVGFVLLLVGVGLAIYANRLRKKRE